MRRKAVIIFGPTAVGKSRIAIELAVESGEIISVDSQQVYKELNIGTAKPDYKELLKVKHHLIDVCSPDEQFTAGDFRRNAESIIETVCSMGKTPFLTGGTGLYYKTLIDGIIEIPRVPDDIKQCLLNHLEQKGQERLYKILYKLDKTFASCIHPNDKQRTLRGLEVYFAHRKKISDYHKETKPYNKVDFIIIGINQDRDLLYKKIDSRVDSMIDNGLVDEVKALLDKGYDQDCPGFKAIGYSEIIDYVNGKYDLNRAVYLIKRNSRRYAKRQLTWFRSVKDVKWFSNTDISGIRSYVNEKIKG